MTEELKKYFQDTKEKRKELLKIATAFQMSILNTSEKINDCKDSPDFLKGNPIKLKRVKKQSEKELEKTYRSNIKSFERINNKRSLSLKRNTNALTNSIYKQHSMLPRTLRQKGSTILDRPLEEKFEIDCSKTISITKVNKSQISSRINSKKDLLIPILSKKSTKSFIN